MAPNKSTRTDSTGKNSVWGSAIGAIVSLAMDRLRDSAATLVDSWSEQAQRGLKNGGKATSAPIHDAKNRLSAFVSSRPVIIGVVVGVVAAFLLMQRKR